MNTLTEAFVLILVAVAAGAGVLALLRGPRYEAPPEVCPHCLGRGRLWRKNAELDQIVLEDPCKRCGGEGMVQP